MGQDIARHPKLQIISYLRYFQGVPQPAVHAFRRFANLILLCAKLTASNHHPCALPAALDSLALS